MKNTYKGLKPEPKTIVQLHVESLKNTYKGLKLYPALAIPSTIGSLKNTYKGLKLLRPDRLNHLQLIVSLKNTYKGLKPVSLREIYAALCRFEEYL